MTQCQHPNCKAQYVGYLFFVNDEGAHMRLNFCSRHRVGMVHEALMLQDLGTISRVNVFRKSVQI